MTENTDSTKTLKLDADAEPKVEANRCVTVLNEKIMKEIKDNPQQFCTLNTPAEFAWTITLSPAKISEIMKEEKAARINMNMLEEETEEATGVSVGICGKKKQEVTKNDGGKLAKVVDDKTAGEELATTDSAVVDKGNKNGEEVDGLS